MPNGVDTPLAYDAATFDLQVGGTAPAPQIVAAAYTKNLPNPGSTATVTTLYGLDANLDLLVTQGGPEGDPSPNAGQLFVVGPTNFDVTADSGFDIETGTDMAFATRTTGGATDIYSISLTTGAGTQLGTVAGQTLRGLSVAPPAGGAGAVSLAASTFTFPAGRGPVAVAVTRTGGASLPATIDFATADAATAQVVGGARAAVAGVDYVPASGTLSFAAGETTKTVFLALPAGSVPTSSPAVFAFNLSNPTGGLTLGSTAAAVVTIPAVTATNSGRLFAVGAGAGGAPVVAVYDAVSGSELYRFLAFEQTFTGGVYVATADVNGDGFDDIIAGAGAGGGPRIAVFDGSVTDRSLTNRGAILADFFAYEEAARVGVIVAAGDVSGDGIADVIAGTGVGGGPRVRVIDGTALTTTPGALQPSIADFFAYEESARGGVNVAAGEFTGDGFADVVAGSGNGGGPRVRLFDGKAVVGSASPGSLSDYFAYEEGFRGGVFVAAGDVDGDNFSDLITGTGVGGGPRVSVFSRGREAQRTGDFFAFDGAFRGGVRVAAEDFGADGSDSVITAPGRGAAGTFRTFTPTGTQVSETTFDAGFTGGLFIG